MAKLPVHPQTKCLSSLDIMMIVEGVCQCSCQFVCCTEFLNKFDDYSQSLGILLIYFGCYRCIPKALTKCRLLQCHCQKHITFLLFCCDGCRQQVFHCISAVFQKS